MIAAEIRARLKQWIQNFNAGHKDAACDLFSKELFSKFRGKGKQGTPLGLLGSGGVITGM
jgi:hypothetical protein